MTKLLEMIQNCINNKEELFTFLGDDGSNYGLGVHFVPQNIKLFKEDVFVIEGKNQELFLQANSSPVDDGDGFEITIQDDVKLYVCKSV